MHINQAVMRSWLVAALVCVSSLAHAQTPVTQYPFAGVTPPIFGLPTSGVNGGGTVTSPQLLLPDGTAALPGLGFILEADLGWRRSATSTVGFGKNANVITFNGVTGTLQLGTDSSTFTIGASNDVVVAHEAADHWFQRRTTNAQRASWANTYTSTISYEAFSIDWQTTANVGIAGCRTAATGTGRSCRFASQANNAGTISYLEIGPTGSTTLTGAFTSYNGVAAAGQGMAVVRAQATTGSVVNSGTASIATWTPGAADVEVEIGCRVNITVSTNHTFSCDVTYTDVSNAARTRVLEMFPITGTPLTSGLMTNAIGAGDFGSAVIRIGVKASTAIVVRTSAGGTFTTVSYTASGTIKQVG